MFSISKSLALIAILAIVWYGYRLIGRLDEARKHKVDRSAGRGANQGSGRTGGKSAPEPQDGVLDLVQDETGAYVAKEKQDRRT